MKYLVTYYYDERNGSCHEEIEANSVEDAVNEVTKSLGANSTDEEGHYTRDKDTPEEFVIEKPLPLNPGQHPETPPLYQACGCWKTRWSLIVEAELQPDDEESV